MGVLTMNKELSERAFEERVEDLRNQPEEHESLGAAPADPQDDYRTLCEKSLAGLYVIQKGRFSYVNSMLSNILGYEGPEELIGKSFWELIHPDDRGLVKLGMEEEQTEVFPDQPIFRVFKKDGTILWVRMEGSTTIYKGKPAIVGHLIDLTPFKKNGKIPARFPRKVPDDHRRD